MDLMRVLIGLTTLIQTAEDFLLRPSLERERPWALVRREVPVRRAFDVLYSTVGVTILLAARAVAGIALILTPHPLDAGVLIFATWAWAVRWRGTFNGGSDAMTLVVLIGTLISLLDVRYQTFAAAYVAAHLIVSFFVAGVVKLKNRDWRSGVATAVFLSDAGLGVAPSVAKAAAWATMLFEVFFPLSLASPAVAIAATAVGLAFHLSNAYVFGLNRFWWAWGAAYPALLALVHR